jgi:hypothetical protein
MGGMKGVRDINNQDAISVMIPQSTAIDLGAFETIHAFRLMIFGSLSGSK